ncbi:MAG: ATP-binding protein [Christensenellaceae bacterium]|jgi:predicted AAA+ superfamily ATPase|nr:ATP-binding protein [Christensenellaceae bacterium]
MKENLLFSRDTYLQTIRNVIGSEDVKIIIGMRRSGKSRFLLLLRNDVLKRTDAEHIIYINFEDIEYDKLKVSATAAHEYILDRMKDDGKYYLFLDEIQEVTEWQKLVNSLRLRNTDIYITGSNSKIFSGVLATYLTGRCYPMNIYPLSFAEFIEFRKQSGLSKLKNEIKPGSSDYEYGLKDELAEYVRIGGFPLLSTFPYSQNDIKTLVESIHSTAVLRDVIQRNVIRNTQLLEKIVAFIYDNIGSLISITNIVNYLKEQKRSAEYETIANYLKALEDAYIVQRAQRYDVKGKKLLETNDKYYIADHSLQYAVRGNQIDNSSGVLENIVFMELVRRGYKVYVGKINMAASKKKNEDEENNKTQKKAVDREIDFVAEKNGSKVYVQVTTNLLSEDVIEREFRPLEAVRDHYPKYVVVYDSLFVGGNYNGVKCVTLKDFLLKQEL